MNKLVKFSGMLSVGLLLAACQDTASTETGSEAEATEESSQASAVPSEITVKGVAEHYHTGDEVELTAVPDVETDLSNWQWYIKEDEASDWEAVAGLTSDVFSREATINGLQVKAELLDADEAAIAESEPVEVVIDDHGANDELGRRIYNGFFYNDEVQDRTLADWEGEWQSIYPYLENGDLDIIFEDKASHSDTMNAEEYKEYYRKGYVTDVDHMDIKDDSFTFYYEDGSEMTAEYAYDGYEILNYERGNRGVRFIFSKSGGSEDMPQYIQFSDHGIAPQDATHFHIYWGDDNQELLEEVTNWPTYYPKDWDTDAIVRDMFAH
ncbi:ZinT family metal-binding protein [Marinilactibacillus piezotolerans]|uniref:ZinT family metal-binding protein n=1 Tax=Marinilactibacillus piezotolerans TaxID=258723 RepID=UPI0009B16A73|nr:metal-binding protein ZinT [Marinilactibacillus piezotolerans]